MYEEEIHFGKLLLKQFEMVLEHLTMVTLTFDLKINRVQLLHRTNVWTKFEEGRSRGMKTFFLRPTGGLNYKWSFTVYR